MINEKNSQFETYLMDQEVELNVKEAHHDMPKDHIQYELYPEGFFTSL
ncbi:MAG: hypothetical protein RR595_02355 [Lysinibacillus sp.]